MPRFCGLLCELIRCWCWSLVNDRVARHDGLWGLILFVGEFRLLLRRGWLQDRLADIVSLDFVDRSQVYRVSFTFYLFLYMNETAALILVIQYSCILCIYLVLDQINYGNPCYWDLKAVISSSSDGTVIASTAYRV
jgi:hypothetical protein